ncbi:MAG TPA: histidine kinase [Chitinophagaceae bacterium]
MHTANNKTRKVAGFILLLFWLITGNHCVAQVFDETSFTRYTKLEGLSHNYITGIVQDSSGYIWVATNKGLNRFDGKYFSNFYKSTENSPIPENLILSLQLQNGNEIIGTTVAGAFSYNTLSRKHTYFIVPTDPLIYFWANQGWQIVKDNKGNYVVSTKTGLFVFNPDGKIINRYDHFKPTDAGKIELWFGNWLSVLSNGNIFQENNLAGSLYQPASNRIDPLYATRSKNLQQLRNGKMNEERISFPVANNELFIPNKEKSSFDVYNLVSGDHASYPVPAFILSDLNWYSRLFYINDSLLAITSTVGGFYLLHYSPAQKKLFCDGEKKFASKYCTSLLRDREGRLWIGTKDGLYKENTLNSFFSVQNLATQDTSILNTGISSVFVVQDKIVIGLKNEGGLLLLDRKTKQTERTFNFSRLGPGSSTIYYIFLYHPDTLWLGTGKGILWLNIKNYSAGRVSIPGQPAWMNETKARTFFVDTHNDIWLSFGELNSVVRIDRATHSIYDLSKSPLLKITFCFSMNEDLDQNIWLAGDGLCRWNRKKNRIDTLIPYPSVTRSLFNFMDILARDDHNNLWLASFDNEILQYDCSNNKMYLRLPESSMIDGYAVTNSPIINNHIWMGMSNGISAFSIKDYGVKQFSYADGLPSAAVTSFRRGSYYNAAEDLFYFGAGQYLISFTPDISLSAKTLPKFSIEIPGMENISSGKISLPYSQNNLELRFNAINFNDPEESRFAYRLLNEKDSSWSEIDTRNLLLGKLFPGNHSIEVKLYSVNNRWPSQVKTINITVHPPFWNTTWFLSGLIFLVIATIYFLYRRRIRQIQQRANLDKLLAQTEMKALHSQMNPHFIFNCLNSIREMILNNENNQASLYLSKFARLIRITLDHSSKAFITLDETIDYLQRYLEMERIRTNKFVYSIEVDERLQSDEILLPPNMIQPFMENAIWHGAGLEKEMQLSIKFKKKEDGLVCIVEDNGIGIDASLKNKTFPINHQSVGISNTRQRIKVLNEKYNLKCSLQIEDRSVISTNETGTIVRIYLPFKTTDL